MDLDSGICEPTLKKERFDKDLEMVNFEVPLQIDVPVASDADIDPLLPVNNQEPPNGVQPLGIDDFVQPISASEIKEESPLETDTTEPHLPNIDLSWPRKVLPEGQTSESLDVDNSNHDEFEKEICISSDEEVEEITIEPKREEISREDSRSVDCEFQLVVGDDGPEIRLLNSVQRAPNNQHDAPLLKTQLAVPPLNQLQVGDSAVDVSSLSQLASYTSNVLQDGVLGSPGARHTSTNTLKDLEVWKTSSADAPPVAPSSPQVSENKLLRSLIQPKYNPFSSATTPVVSSPCQDLPNNLAFILEPLPVTGLLKTPFTSNGWTSEQKDAIIKSTRPKPTMALSPTLPSISAERFYNEIPWLCGSSALNKFFCWPCLLFFYSSTHTELWSIPAALAALEGEFHKSWKAHEVTDAHQAARKALKIWRKSVAAPNPDKEHNVRNYSTIERVRKNRKLLSLLVQSICYLKKERHNAKVDDYAECFGYIVKSNLELQRTLAEFQGGLSTKSVADFVYKYANLAEDAVLDFSKSKILDEIKNARFITLFMEDLLPIVDKSNVALIGHFIDRKGDIQERILKVIEIGYDRSAESMFKVFQNVVFDCGLRLKVAGFTYSATLVHPSETAAFNKRVEQMCPVAKFFHYQRHDLSQTLFGALSHLNRNCRNFFLTITEFQQFFNDPGIISETLRGFEQENNSELPQLTFDFGCGFITTLERSYSSVLKTLGRIFVHPEEWDHRISSQAPLFMSFLQEFRTRFMITVISRLNAATMDITVALQGKIDAAEWKQQIRRGISSLMNIKKYGLKDIYLTALSPVLVKGSEVQTSDFPAGLVAIFNEIIDTAIDFLHQRFNAVDLGYVDLETVAKRYYSRLNLRPEDADKFRSQIHYLAKEPMIKDKTLPETLKYFYDHNLATAVPEYATFLDFAMTIPSSNSSLHCPVVERILKNQRYRSFNPPKDSIWMENELLTDIFKQKTLCEAVIDIIVAHCNTKEFSYQDIGQ